MNMKVMEWKMSSMNFTCDVCGREVFSCTFVNGMKFCAKCYQETFGETDKDIKISDLEAQIAEMQNKSFILYSMLYETLEKQGCDNVASQIDQTTGWTYDKEADWLKGNRNYDQLKQQLHDLPKKIVEEIRDCVSKRIMEKEIKWGDNIQIGFICNAINECLDAILKKFGDKNESNND